MRFLGGFHGFPGGKVDAGDERSEVRHCPEPEQARLIACAVRETFEETGVLLVRGGDKLTRGQRVSLHDDLVSGRSRFAEILEHWGLWIDARDLTHTGFWTTPEFSPLRYRTHFYIAVCPPRQEPYEAVSEMLDVEFVDPSAAVSLWDGSKVLIAPPVLISLRALAAHGGNTDAAAVQLRRMSAEADGDLDHIELNGRLICLPLRTDTLPPATHTNCFIAGKEEYVVIDAAAREAEERAKLYELIGDFEARGRVCRGIVVSHLHPDHFGGETALKEHFYKRYGREVPVAAHRLTAESLKKRTAVDRFLEDGDSYTLKDGRGEPFELEVLHTPGHARGHLCFYDRGLGFLLSSDNVVGLGTVLIDPPEGNMSDYLESLARMRDLPGLNFLCGSHGAAVADARGRIEEYIAHRLEREGQIARAVADGARTESEIARAVYRDLDPTLLPLAERSVAAHLERLSE